MISMMDHWNAAWDNDTVSFSREDGRWVPNNDISRQRLKEHANLEAVTDAEFDDVSIKLSGAGFCIETIDEDE